MKSTTSSRTSGSTVESGIHPVSVDTAVESLTPRFRADEATFVAGSVAAVRTYEPWHYVDLMGTEAQLTCRLPLATPAPVQGQRLIVHGILSVRPSKYKGGLEVMLTGDVVGAWRQAPATRSGAPLLRAHTPQRLARLFSQEVSPRITVIATRTAWEDASRAGLNQGSAFLRWAETSFGRRDVILDVLEDHGDSDATAFAILRGGGDPRGLEIWNDPDVVEAILRLHRPVYTALGHSTDLLLADRYADEAFDTPTSFGNAIGQLLEERRWRARRAEETRDATARLAQAEARNASLRRTVTILAGAALLLLLFFLLAVRS